MKYRNTIITIVLTIAFCLVTWLWLGDKNIQFNIQFNTFTPMPETEVEKAEILDEVY